MRRMRGGGESSLNSDQPPIRDVVVLVDPRAAVELVELPLVVPLLRRRVGALEADVAGALVGPGLVANVGVLLLEPLMSEVQ